jgi:ubiquitin carboxyl-terminal hydrolase 8
MSKNAFFTNNTTDSESPGLSCPSLSQDSVSRNGQAAPTDQDLKARFERLAMSSSQSSLPTRISQRDNRHLASPSLYGPREMPPKLPLLNVDAMPRLPAPTYSPATSFGSPTGIPPQRNFARSSLLQQGPTASLAGASEPRPTFAKETTVSADMLYSYLSESKLSVLLLDVRRREEFDQGHIFARRIVCIEPIVLRDG